MNKKYWRLGGVAASTLSVLGASPAQAEVIYWLQGRCLMHEQIGTSPIAYACPSLIAGSVRMPSGYVPGSLLLASDGIGEPTVSLGAPVGIDWLFQGTSWGITMPVETGAPFWGWINPVANYQASGGNLMLTFEADTAGNFFRLEMDQVIVQLLPHSVPVGTTLSLAMLGLAMLSVSRRRAS